MYLYYRLQELKRYLDTLPEEKRNVFELAHVILDKKPEEELIALPLKEKLTFYKDRNEAVQHLRVMGLLEENEELLSFFPLRGEDFDVVEEGYTQNDIIANMDKFKFDGSIGKVIFDDNFEADKGPVRYCCTETIGDNEDRIADVCKTLECLLLLVTNKLAADQKQQFINIVDEVDLAKDLVVSKKYANPADFISVFLEREKRMRKILDRKY